MENQENPEKTAEKSDFQEKLDLFLKDLQVLKDKHGIEFEISLDFPNYKVLPDDLRLALMVMSKHNPRFVMGFKDKEKK